MSKQLRAIRTKLGWTLFGASIQNTEDIQCNMLHLETEDRMCRMVKDFWGHETYVITPEDIQPYPEKINRQKNGQKNA